MKKSKKVLVIYGARPNTNFMLFQSKDDNHGLLHIAEKDPLGFVVDKESEHKHIVFRQTGSTDPAFHNDKATDTQRMIALNFLSLEHNGADVIKSVSFSRGGLDVERMSPALDWNALTPSLEGVIMLSIDEEEFEIRFEKTEKLEYAE